MIQQTKTIDFTAALDSPTSFFAEPQDVVTHPKLSREQKLAILRRWEQDALRLSTSEAEGMGGGEESMLGRVETALRAAAS
jgi:hypothetical protein